MILISLQAFGQEPAGEVADFVGEAWVLSGGEKHRPSLKQPIYAGDILETKKNGAIKILFKDDTLLTLKENSKTIITEYLFEPKTKKRRAVFNALFGKVRTVVGRFFGKDEVVEIRTPTAVAGIRGTDIGAVVTKNKTIFYCFSGICDVHNISLPEQKIEMMAGTFTEITQSAAPIPLAPIPETIETNKENIFDIPLSQQPEAKPQASAETTATSAAGAAAVASSGSTQSAGTQVVQTAREEVNTHTASTATLPASLISETETLLNIVAVTSQVEEFTTNTTPATTTTQGLEIVPGGATAATNPATITITFPQ
ncbi:MAG: FecR family protein [Deltaproteobacteria bacterium]|nr:FecR family protein [Deltaproteobacteria bacterium]